MRTFNRALLLCLVSVSLWASAFGYWTNCAETSVMFKDFTVFPNPANVGDTIHIRAVVQPDQIIHDGVIQLRIIHNNSDAIDPIVNIPGIPLCNISDSVQCPIDTSEHIYTWDFVVPAIPVGSYVVRFDLKPLNASAWTPGCLLFWLQVAGTGVSNQSLFNSWYEAVIQGTAVFENTNVNDRSIGEIVQVGPNGLFPNSVSNGFSYGIFSSVEGSGDLVPAGGLNTDGYIWGMSGSMTTMKVQNTTLQQIFEGEFYVGYAPTFTNYSNSLFSGSFTLTWNWNADRSQATINGYLNISQDATLPSNWPNPILFGRLSHIVMTDSYGNLKAQGSDVLCAQPSIGTNGKLGCATPAKVTPATPSGKDSFSNTQLGVTIGVILGFAFLVVLLVAFLTWRKNKREVDEEDGVFAVARKPEYGGALILDDIIQETQGKNRDLRPMLDHRRRAHAEDSLSEDDDYGFAPNERDSVSREASRSISRSISRSVSRSVNPRYDDATENDSDESRSRSPGSVKGNRRARSTTRSVSAHGRSRSRSEIGNRNGSRPPPYVSDDDDESSAEDPGSSASRQSEAEESDDE